MTLENKFEILKNKGNEQFKVRKFTQAITYYSEAIACKEDEPAAYSNRALCYINLAKYYEAEEDCTKAISIDPNFVKAYYRRATARKELMKHQEAIKDLEKVIKLDPGFELANKEVHDIKTMLKEDKRMSMKLVSKPEKLRSKLPVKMFDLHNHYSGQKLYGN